MAAETTPWRAEIARASDKHEYSLENHPHYDDATDIPASDGSPLPRWIADAATMAGVTTY